MVRTLRPWTHRALVCLLLLTPMITSCARALPWNWFRHKDKLGTATTSCSGLERSISDYGYLNTPHFLIGTVLDIDTSIMKAGRTLTLDVPASDMKDDTTFPSEQRVAHVDFNVKLSADLPLSLAAEVNTAVNNNTFFRVTNDRRRDILSPVGTIKKLGQMDDVRKMIAIPGHAVLMVNSVLLADSLMLRVKNTSGSKLDVNVFRFGHYKVQVDYECQDGLATMANSGPVFYKVVQLTDDGSGGINAVTSTIDMNKLDLQGAITSK
jgi:hypothetical protein